MTGVRGFTGWLGIVLGSPNPQSLARFYQQLLGWEISSSSATWVDMLIRDPQGRGTSSNLAFQLEKNYEPPVWPSEAGHQQMQFHLDVGVVDVAAAAAEALAIGASLADYQPQDDVRVMLDPDGHPFCLYEDKPMPP
jgi:catechol 2,3-dioxygenase-like lactoylglutathione lyase family enzyme